MVQKRCLNRSSQKTSFKFHWLVIFSRMYFRCLNRSSQKTSFKSGICDLSSKCPRVSIGLHRRPHSSTMLKFSYCSLAKSLNRSSQKTSFKWIIVFLISRYISSQSVFIEDLIQVFPSNTDVSPYNFVSIGLHRRPHSSQQQRSVQRCIFRLNRSSQKTSFKKRN